MISRLPLTAASATAAAIARSSRRRVAAAAAAAAAAGSPPPPPVSTAHLPLHVRTLVASASSPSYSSSTPPSRPAMPTHKYETPASPKVEKVFQKILNLDMFEVHLVTELLAERLGMNVNQAALARGASGGGKGGASGGEAKEEAKVEEKTAFDLKLTGFDAKAKIKVIKEVRSIAGLGLKEAKELVEGAPKTVMKDIKKEEAEEMKAKLEELGATVEIV